MRSMQWQLGVLGTISAFAYRHRETKKHLCQDGRSQDLLSTDFQPAVRHPQYVRQQYTHSKTVDGVVIVGRSGVISFVTAAHRSSVEEYSLQNVQLIRISGCAKHSEKKLVSRILDPACVST